MRICTISYHCCPYSLMGKDGVGGMNVYLRELCSILSSLPDVEVDVFTRCQGQNLDEVKNLNEKLRIIHLKAGPEYTMDRIYLYDYLNEFSDNLLEFIQKEKEKYDLIFSHYWLSGLIGERIKQSFSIPLAHVFHTLAFLKGRAFGLDGDHPCRLKAEEHLCRAADLVITSSSLEKKDLIDEYGIESSHIKVIYPGINAHKFSPDKCRPTHQSPGKEEKKLVLLYVGRLEPIKGFYSLVEAFEFLKQKRPSLYQRLKLLVIGGGSLDDLNNSFELKRIRKNIKKYSMEEEIQFLGSKRQDQLAAYYSAADALIVPSLYESFGLVVLESLACGTPVLLSRIGQMSTIIEEGKNGFSFQAGNPQSIADTIELFFKHKDDFWKADTIREKVVQRFSWDKTASEVIAAFVFLKGGSRETTKIFQCGESPQPV